MNKIHTHNELEKKEDYIRHLVVIESSEDAIISKSLDGIINIWNKRSEKLFGYTADEAVGKPITLLKPQHFCMKERIPLKVYAITK